MSSPSAAARLLLVAALTGACATAPAPPATRGVPAPVAFPLATPSQRSSARILPDDGVACLCWERCALQRFDAAGALSAELALPPELHERIDFHGAPTPLPDGGWLVPLRGAEGRDGRALRVAVDGRAALVDLQATHVTVAPSGALVGVRDGWSLVPVDLDPPGAGELLYAVEYRDGVFSLFGSLAFAEDGELAALASHTTESANMRMELFLFELAAPLEIRRVQRRPLPPRTSAFAVEASGDVVLLVGSPLHLARRTPSGLSSFSPIATDPAWSLGSLRLERGGAGVSVLATREGGVVLERHALDAD
ncbi:MAG: hypothetical protein H6828_09320 [Planctomycetes bacterium]|nr:hypothetical protein [Planctomycetota bacterium]